MTALSLIGLGGVTEEAPGPRDRAAEGGSEGVKNCYGKKQKS